MGSNSKHSCSTAEWYTPLNVIKMAHDVLGGIDLDPSSCAVANERVRANRYFDKQIDGLTQTWSAHSVFVNPSSGRQYGIMGQPGKFWGKLIKERPNFGHAIFLAYSIEQLQTSQSQSNLPMISFPLCIPKRRLCLYNPERVTNYPTHGNAIIYVPSQIDNSDTFRQVFSELGAVK